MQKRTCPNGHIYDYNIYGDTCPLCQSSAQGAKAKPIAQPIRPQANSAKTKMVPPGMNIAGGRQVIPGVPHVQQAVPAGETRMVSPGMMHLQGNPGVKQGNPMAQAKNAIQQQQPAVAAPKQEQHTIIRRPDAAMAKGGTQVPARKLVGFLVTYNRNPMGKAFNIYEGRNTIGSGPSCDISIPDDHQMSSHHMTIRFLSGNNKFQFRDELSSNGTYVNKQLMDEGELQNYDIIRIGGTLFIFIEIPLI